MRKKYLWFGLIGVVVVVAAIAAYIFLLGPDPYTPAITDDAGNEVPGSIAAIETITLGGVEQTLTIRGVDSTNPVLLILHGGPGMPSSPWATWNGYHAGLEEHFVVVHWDQRGAGKSFSKDLTEEDMLVEKFVGDTLELAGILRERFGQDKIFLWGHSWGAGLGFEVLQVSEAPFYAFFASGVRPEWNSTSEEGYQRVLELARQAGDVEAVEALEAIQPFDPENFEHLQVRGEYLAQYLVGDFHTEGLMDEWLGYVMKGKSPEYTIPFVLQTFSGMDFTNQTTSAEILDSDFNLFTDFPVSTIPVHFFMGRYDYECPGELAEEYFNALTAPDKSFTWFENSAHNMYYDEADLFNQTLIRIADEILASLGE